MDEWLLRYRANRMMGFRPWRALRIAFTGFWQSDLAHRDAPDPMEVIRALGRKRG